MSVSRSLDTRIIGERNVWDAVVQSFAARELRQGFEWGELRREQGWQIHRVAVVRDRECLAAAAMQYRRLGPLGTIMYAPRGPLWRAEAPEGLAALVEHIRTLAARIGAIFLRVSPGIPHDDDRRAAQLQGHGFRPLAYSWSTWNVPRHIQILDVTPPESELIRHVRERYRRYIRNVGRKEVTIEAGGSESDIAAFHRLMQNLGRLKKFPVRDLDHYRRFYGRYARDGQAQLLMARVGDEVVGGLLAFRFGGRVYVHASSVRADSARPLHGVAPAMFWDCIRRAKAADAELVDFGSSGVREVPDATHPNYGLFQFKAGLGCRFVSCLPYHDLIFRPLAYRAFRRGEEDVVPYLHQLVARAPALLHLIKKVA